MSEYEVTMRAVFSAILAWSEGRADEARCDGPEVGTYLKVVGALQTAEILRTERAS